MRDHAGPTPPSSPASQPPRRSDFFSFGWGCLLGLVTLLAISIVGVFVFALVIDARHAGSWTASILSVFAFIGFVMGSIVFLRVTAPSISIKGIGPIPAIAINPGRAGKGILNPGVIRTFMGLIACNAVYLIFTTLIALTADNEGALTRVLFFLGIMLGPILGVLIAQRTSIS